MPAHSHTNGLPLSQEASDRAVEGGATILLWRGLHHSRVLPGRPLPELLEIHAAIDDALEYIAAAPATTPDPHELRMAACHRTEGGLCICPQDCIGKLPALVIMELILGENQAEAMALHR